MQGRRWCAGMLVAAMVVPACTATDMGTKQAVGTVLGAGTGALAGSQIGGGRGKLIAVAVGTLAGALLGAEIGRSLDRADQLAMQGTAQRGLETSRTGETSTWLNPDTGSAGAFTPQRTFDDGTGRPCRDYEQTLRIDGEDRLARGTACRQPDGTWVITR